TSGGEVIFQPGITSTSFTDTGLINGQTYFYKVSAVNSAGESAPSSEVQATPNSPPSVINQASANPNPVAGRSTNMSVLGLDQIGETLTYTWGLASGPSGANPIFSDNGSTTANNTTVTFNEAGTYTFQVTFSDTSGLSNSSSVTLVVNQTETSIGVSPVQV